MKAGWTEVALGDICELRYGKALKNGDRDGGSFTVYGSNGPVGRHSAHVTVGATIVIGRKGSVGEAHFSERACWPIDTTYYIDETATMCDLPWLFHTLPQLRLTELNRAAAIPGLSREDAYRQRLVLPPRSEQKRIARQFALAKAAQSARFRSERFLDAMESAVFATLFEERGAPVSWPQRPLAELCTTSSGGTPARSVKANFSGEIPWIKSGELRSRVVVSSEESISAAAAHACGARVLPAGTVLVAMYGATAGVVASLRIEATTNQAVCALEPGPLIKGAYLEFALRQTISNLLAKRAGGAQPNLNQTKVREHLIPAPPMHLQTQFEAVLVRADAIRRSVRRHNDALRELQESIGQRSDERG